MKVKIISLLILGLCLLSIIIGLLSFNRKGDVKKACAVSSEKSFLMKFSSGDKIALITLQGPISYDMKNNFFGDLNSAGNVLESLKKASKDRKVKGVIFRVNSPGGTVAMSQEIYNSILKLRKKKPVVVSMADVAASGGYYISSAADRIYADPGTLTGSIGVIMETINAQGFLTDKLGIKSEVIKSGKYKDAGNFYRPLTGDEKILLTNLVNNAYHQFLNAVIVGRVNRNDNYKTKKTDLSEKTLKKYADGRVFTGEQALSYGFIDKLGGLTEATEGIRQMAKQKFPFISKDIPVVDYNKTKGVGELLFHMLTPMKPVQGLERLLPLSKRSPRQPLFIWE